MCNSPATQLPRVFRCPLIAHLFSKDSSSEKVWNLVKTFRHCDGISMLRTMCSVCLLTADCCVSVQILAAGLCSFLVQLVYWRHVDCKQTRSKSNQKQDFTNTFLWTVCVCKYGQQQTLTRDHPDNYWQKWKQPKSYDEWAKRAGKDVQRPTKYNRVADVSTYCKGERLNRREMLQRIDDGFNATLNQRLQANDMLWTFLSETFIVAFFRGLKSNYGVTTTVAVMVKPLSGSAQEKWRGWDRIEVHWLTVDPDCSECYDMTHSMDDILYSLKAILHLPAPGGMPYLIWAYPRGRQLMS